MSKKVNSITGVFIYNLMRIFIGVLFLAIIAFFINGLFTSYTFQAENIRTNTNQGWQDTSLQKSSLENVLKIAANIQNNRTPVTSSCGSTNPVPGKEGWIEYHNAEFQYSFQYPNDMFEIYEFSDCSLIELIPPASNDELNTASVYTYYISFMAIHTQNSIDASDWLTFQLQDLLSLPDISPKIRERQFSIGEITLTEMGPLPGQVSKNVLSSSSSNILLQIDMYPAPVQPGSTDLPSIGTWHSSQEMFPSLFYQILGTLRMENIVKE